MAVVIDYQNPRYSRRTVPTRTPARGSTDRSPPVQLPARPRTQPCEWRRPPGRNRRSRSLPRTSRSSRTIPMPTGARRESIFRAPRPWRIWLAVDFTTSSSRLLATPTRRPLLTMPPEQDTLRSKRPSGTTRMNPAPAAESRPNAGCGRPQWHRNTSAPA